MDFLAANDVRIVRLCGQNIETRSSFSHDYSFEWAEWRIVRREVYSTRVSETAKVMHFKFSVHIQNFQGSRVVYKVHRAVINSTAFLFWCAHELQNVLYRN